MGQATDTYAALTRQQWADYIQQWVPYENKLIDYATNPNTLGDAMAEASSDVNTAFDARAASTQRRMNGLGLSMDADETKTAARTLGLARSLADVNAQNTARDATMARQQSILGNPAPRIGALGLGGGGGT